MEEKKLICINCPLGCRLTVAMDGETILGVSGNTCMRGDSYARRELTNPTRIVTSTLKDVTAKAPVRIGDVIVENILGTGVDIVATKNVEAAE